MSDLQQLGTRGCRPDLDQHELAGDSLAFLEIENVDDVDQPSALFDDHVERGIIAFETTVIREVDGSCMGRR